MVVSMNSVIIGQDWRVSSFFSFLFLISRLSHLYIISLNIQENITVLIQQLAYNQRLSALKSYLPAFVAFHDVPVVRKRYVRWKSDDELPTGQKIHRPEVSFHPARVRLYPSLAVSSPIASSFVSESALQGKKSLAS